MGHSVIMGRKTWESIPEKFRPLPGRKNIVITRQPEYNVPDNVIRCAGIGQAIDEGLKIDSEIYFIGGEQVYREALHLCNKMEITEIHDFYEGDAFFPKVNQEEWYETDRKDMDRYTFVSYLRMT